MGVLAWITGLLLTVAFLGSGAAKLTKQKMAVEVAERLKYTNLMPLIGGAEIVGAVGVFVGLLSNGKGLEFAGLLGGVGLLAVMLGAIAYHRRAGDAPKEMAPAVVLGLLSVLYLIAIGAR